MNLKKQNKLLLFEQKHGSKRQELRIFAKLKPKT